MTNIWGTLPRRGEHYCAEVHFERGQVLGHSPIACACGWRGVLGDWPNHAPHLAISRSAREADPALPWLALPSARVISAALP